MNAEGGRSRVEIVEPLRGFAALAVSWYHFTQGGGLMQPGWLKSTGTYGWLGVEVFFVVSGFVIPFAMNRGQYIASADLGTFLLKRIVRLYPPYLFAIALVLVLWYLSAAIPGFRGTPPSVELVPLILHFGYLNSLLGYPWALPVMWSLAIEFQFYVLVAFAYP